MARKLRVYGWQGYRYDAPKHGDTREIVAATSMREAARAAGEFYSSGEPAPQRLFNLCETGNAREIETAMTEPGVIFWRGLDEFGGPYRRS